MEFGSKTEEKLESIENKNEFKDEVDIKKRKIRKKAPVKYNA